MTRAYRLGRRQASVDRTAQAILGAARQLLSQRRAGEVSVGSIARAAGVSRLTVYQRFGSKSEVFAALLPAGPPALEPASEPREALRGHLLQACTTWAADPALYRHLPAAIGTGQGTERETERRLAEQLLAGDALRPGCSLREAEDVIGALGSFEVFDRLYRDGRRAPAAVADILMRLARGILA